MTETRRPRESASETFDNAQKHLIEENDALAEFIRGQDAAGTNNFSIAEYERWRRKRAVAIG